MRKLPKALWVQQRHEKYQRYLKSWAWAKLKRKSRKIYGDACVVCGRTKNIHFHHIRYSSDLRKVKAIDVCPLCNKCHFTFHEACKSLSMSPVGIQPSEISEIITYWSN